MTHSRGGLVTIRPVHSETIGTSKNSLRAIEEAATVSTRTQGVESFGPAIDDTWRLGLWGGYVVLWSFSDRFSPFQNGLVVVLRMHGS